MTKTTDDEARGVTNCPRCGAPGHVLETRGARRRRRCSACGQRWTTREVPADLPAPGTLRAAGAGLARLRTAVESLEREARALRSVLRDN